MSKSSSFECSSGCRSQQHGAQITAAIVRGTEVQAIAYLKNLCHRCHLVTDSLGRSALHTAASCGKRKIVRWLLAQGVPLNQKDLESGYTPLHRALFYGQVHVAVDLIKAGVNISALDYDALTPLDHINFDRPPLVSFSFSLPKHVYVWGHNAHFNLGQSHQRIRTSPEWLEFFHREGQVIADIALNKFHTLFLATNGRVYACGLGQGGRLGLDITSPLVIPRPVKGLLPHNVVKIAAGPDHSMFLTDTGQVWTCGTNFHHQLGIIPPPADVYTPRLLSWHKTHKEEVIVGIGAAKFHSIIWTPKVLYTYGLNGGQLGHFRNDNEPTIVSPRRVTSIVLRDEGILACVGVSDGATVVSTSYGDIYVLHQYQTRKVASKMLGIVKIACTGGHLDSKAGIEGLTEKGGSSLKIAVLVGNGLGHLYLWTEETSHLSRCLFTINRKISLVDICLDTKTFYLVSDEGEAFSALALPTRERKTNDKVLGKPWGPSRRFNEFIDRSSCIMLRLTRIVSLHRTVGIMCDPKGQNFAALQNDPRSFLIDLPQVSPSTMGQDLGNLLAEACAEDSVHDVILECEGLKFPAHSYILAFHSRYFRNLLTCEEDAAKDEKSANFPKVCGNLQDSNKKCLVITDVKPEILQEILKFIYSGTCQLTSLGYCQFNSPSEVDDVNRNGNGDVDHDWLYNGGSQYDNNANQSAHLVYKEENNQMKNSMNLNKKKKKSQKNNEGKDTSCSTKRPLKVKHAPSFKKPLHLLQEAAKKLQIPSLIQQVGKLEMVNGFIQLKQGYQQRDLDSSKAPQYHREMYQDLWDVKIESKTGDIIGAHKCILAARLDYFHCMFSATWIEAVSSKSLSIPLPTSILTMLLDYLYEDDCSKLNTSRDVEFLCNILVYADQFLMSRLKEICEVAISGMLTLKNAGEILDFSVNFNCDQLKTTTMQFISLNLAAMLESGSLVSVNSDALADLSTYYQQFIPRMSCRHLTPFDQPPYTDELERLLEEKPLTLPDSEEEWDDLSIGKGEKNQNSSRKKKRTRRNSQGESRVRKTSTSSQLSVSSSDCDISRDLEDEFETLNFDDLEERQPSEFKRENSYGDMISPVRTDIDVRFQNQQLSGLNSWRKASRKKSTSGPSCNTTPTETPRESLLEENAAVYGTSKSNISRDNQSLASKDKVHPSNNVSRCSEPPQRNFPSLVASFSKNPKASLQIKNNKMTKLSQKQRKKQAAEAAAAAVENEVDETPRPDAPVSPWSLPSPAWGNDNGGVDNSEGRKKSLTLADIMKSEASVKPKQTTSPINIHTSKTHSGAGAVGFTSTKKGRYKEDVPPHEGSKDSDGGGAWSSLSSPVNVSLPSPGMSLPYPTTPSFSDILLEEETNRGNLLREQCKPLSLIQLEDKAIEELYAFYGANQCFEENIKVSRVRTVVANPMWRKV